MVLAKIREVEQFRIWATQHPSDEAARCLLDLAYIERHPEDAILLPLFVADFHKLEAKVHEKAQA